MQHTLLPIDANDNVMSLKHSASPFNIFVRFGSRNHQTTHRGDSKTIKYVTNTATRVTRPNVMTLYEDSDTL